MGWLVMLGLLSCLWPRPRQLSSIDTTGTTGTGTLTDCRMETAHSTELESEFLKVQQNISNCGRNKEIYRCLWRGRDQKIGME